jgi:hypothetical protein
MRLSLRARMFPPVHRICFFAVLTCIAALAVNARAADGEKSCGCCSGCTPANQSSSGWRLANTENFCVCCTREQDPSSIGRACESLRKELTQKWLGGQAASETWNSRCYVVVHPTTESYLREVGPGGRSTLGSSLIKTDKGHVVSRRIDLRGDVSNPLRAALPHELTHVVLADAFPGDELPRWADEGMAMLADPPDKLAGHGRDLAAAIADRRAFRIAELLTKQEYPTADGRTIFYGESISVVRYFVSRRSPAEFVRFMHLAASQGYDQSLRDVYSIQDVAQLEHLWRSQTDLALQ